MRDVYIKTGERETIAILYSELKSKQLSTNATPIKSLNEWHNSVASASWLIHEAIEKTRQVLS